MNSLGMSSSSNLLLNLELSRQSLCRLVADFALKNQYFLATAESCTGGLIAASCTDLAGSSQWFDRGFVTYSNAAKADMLGVDTALLAQFGAVSKSLLLWHKAQLNIQMHKCQ
jgi:nicotinamide-nucleotide amidase